MRRRCAGGSGKSLVLRLRALALLLVLALPETIRASEPPRTTVAHLLQGVRAFREGRFAEALVEFRVVEGAPDAPAELAYYLGPTLYKLGRYREALQVFVTSSAPRDALSEFYFGTTPTGSSFTFKHETCSPLWPGRRSGHACAREHFDTRRTSIGCTPGLRLPPSLTPTPSR